MSGHPLTPIQRRLAESVRQRLLAFNVRFSERVDANAEAPVFFEVETVNRELHAVVIVLDDSFRFSANEAELYLDRVAWEDTDTWVAECLKAFDSLFSNDLRIRVRQTALGGAAGAVWIPSAAAWNGERGAYLGQGTERVFTAPWYRST